MHRQVCDKDMEAPDGPLLPKCVASTIEDEPDAEKELRKEDGEKPGFSNYFKDAEWYSLPPISTILTLEKIGYTF